MHVTVVTEQGARHDVPIDARTRIGEVLQSVASKVSHRPNLNSATLHFRGSLLPLDLRACALPEKAVLHFSMLLGDPHMDNTANATIDASIAGMNKRCRLAVQLPSSKDTRWVHADPDEPIRCLRDALEIPPEWLIHYNKRPILDEERTIASLRMSDRYMITFGPYKDTSLVTVPLPANPTAAAATLPKPNSQRNSLYLSELRSPTRQRALSRLDGDARGEGFTNIEVQDRTRLASSAAGHSSYHEVAAPSGSRFAGDAALRRPVTPLAPEDAAVRGNLFDASVSRRSGRGAAPPLDVSAFSDFQRPQQAQSAEPRTPMNGWGGAASPYRADRGAARAASQQFTAASALGGDDERASSRQVSASSRPVSTLPAPPSLQPSSRGSATPAARDASRLMFSSSGASASSMSHLRVLVSDPEDGGFTHHIEVNPTRKVASLLQFVEEPHAYDIFCDTVPVNNPDHVSFFEATSGLHGSLFTFKRRKG